MGKLTAEKKPCQIEDLIQSCVEEMEIAAQKKGLKLFFTKPETKLPEMEIDSFKIGQGLSNLIDNAIRYTQRGEIEIKVKRIDKKIQISVRDTGEGLTKEEQETIFEGFTRGMAGTTFFIEGTGLGLHVAKRYIDLHNGKIWAESEGRGKGSTFYIELPTKRKVFEAGI
jgi:signal transduction histidine kinase